MKRKTPLPSAAVLDAETLEIIAAYEWDGSKMIHDDAVELVANIIGRSERKYRAALRDAVGFIDRPSDAGWSSADVNRLSEIRKLAAAEKSSTVAQQSQKEAGG